MTTALGAMAIAWQHYLAGNLGEAEATYREILVAEPRDANALYLLGAVCQMQGKLAESIAAYRQSIAIDPKVAEAHNNLGAAHALEGRLSEAIACFREAVRLKPDYGEAFTNLAHLHTAVGQGREAAAALREAVRLDPQNGALRAELLIAEASQPAGQAASALEPDTAEALTDQGVILMGEGRQEEAVALWRRALTLKEIPETQNNLGFVHSAREEWDQAMVHLQRALALRPPYAEALNNLGIVHFHQDRADDAVRCFREAVALVPDYADAHNNLGNVLLVQGKALEAGNCYSEVLRLRPNHAETLNQLGVVFNELQQWELALKIWRHSLTVSPDNPATHRHLGHFFYLQHRIPEALPHYRQVLALRPDDADARFSVDVLSGTARPARAPADYVTGLFDSYAGFFDKDLVDRLTYRGPELLKAALGTGPPPRSLAVLDIGCGTGLCGVEFREWARSLVGVDLSPKMLARARQRDIYDELIQNDLLAPDIYPEEKYDLVLAGDVLVYLGELEPLMQAVSRTLRPGGRFAFTVELLDESDYRVLPTGRFAHSQAYLQQLAATNGLREVCMHRAVIRTEQGQDVPGLAVVLSRP